MVDLFLHKTHPFLAVGLRYGKKTPQHSKQHRAVRAQGAVHSTPEVIESQIPTPLLPWMGEGLEDAGEANSTMDEGEANSTIIINSNQLIPQYRFQGRGGVVLNQAALLAGGVGLLHLLLNPSKITFCTKFTGHCTELIVALICHT